MKKLLIIVTLFVNFVFIFSYPEYVKFVPKDFDGVIILKDATVGYYELKKVPIGNFILSDGGLNLEGIVSNILESVGEQCVISSEVFKKTIGKGLLLASKGVTLSFESITSLDINYYLDVLKNLGNNTVLVFKSDSPEKFVRYISCLIGYTVNTDGEFYTLSGEEYTIYAKIFEGYVVFSGSKNTIAGSIAAFKSEEDSLVSSDIYFAKFLEAADKGFLLGYFKKDAFKFELPFKLETQNLETERFELLTNIKDGKINIKIKQFVKGDLDIYKHMNINTENFGDTPLLGDIYIKVSVTNLKRSVMGLLDWYSGKEGEIEKLHEIFKFIADNSNGDFLLIGSLSGATDVALTTTFNYDFETWEDLKALLKKYGAQVKKNEILFDIGKTLTLHFFKHNGYLVVSTVNREVFGRSYKKAKLSDDPLYGYLSKDTKNNCILSVFVNIGNLVEELLGVELNSGLLLNEYVEDDHFLYEMEVM